MSTHIFRRTLPLRRLSSPFRFRQRLFTVTSREPRKRLPVEGKLCGTHIILRLRTQYACIVQSIKKEMTKLQRQYRAPTDPPFQFPLSAMVVGVTGVTYVVCFFGCDKDWFIEGYMMLLNRGGDF